MAQKPKPKPPAAREAGGKPGAKPARWLAVDRARRAGPPADGQKPAPHEGRRLGPAAGRRSDDRAGRAGEAPLRRREVERGRAALYRVFKGETGDDEGNKQLAQYHLAIALYRLKFYQASYGIFSEIADKPNHLKFNETLLWLAKLATQLPEPADIIERVGKYNDEQIARFNNAQQRDLYWQLNYLLGRYKYRNRQYEEAIRLFDKVDRQ